MADLRTDYKDQTLDASVNTQRKYRQVENGDGTVSFLDETVYAEQGDTFGAFDVNEINAKVNEVNASLFSNEKVYTGLNFNNAEFGVYTGGVAPANAGATNYPPNAPTGMLIAFSVYYTSVQLYVTYDNKQIYKRTKFFNGEWTEWVELAIKNDVMSPPNYKATELKKLTTKGESWTATQNCWAIYNVSNPANATLTGTISVDSLGVVYCAPDSSISGVIPIGKDQIIALRSDGDATYTVRMMPCI